MEVGVPISFACICILCFFNTFVCSFFPTVEQEEREKQKAVKNDSLQRRTESYLTVVIETMICFKDNTRSEVSIAPLPNIFPILT